MSKTHVIYGDEDQEYLFELFEKEDEIQRLVDSSNRQLMKQRFKEAKKKKAISDTTVNMVRPKETPEDVKEGEPDKKANKKEEKKENPKPKINAKGVFKIFIVLLLLLGVFVIYRLKDKIIAVLPELPEIKLPTIVKTGDNTDEVIIDSNGGYLTPSTNNEYSIKDVLSVATDANVALRNYYDTIVRLASSNTADHLADVINANLTMINADVIKFESYEKAFAQYTGGTTYYKSIHSRFESVQHLLDEIRFVDANKIYEYINNAIDKENKKVIEDKANLINFLQLNNIPYTDNGDDVIFDVE